MKFSPSVLVVGVLLLIVLVEATAIIWLWVRQRRLQRLCHRWRQIQEQQQADVIGLCAAAVRMDQRLQQLVRDLDEIREQGYQFPHSAETGASYQAAIERIREGGGLEELVGQCGLTREEAGLLLRLYGDHRPEAGGAHDY